MHAAAPSNIKVHILISRIFEIYEKYLRELSKSKDFQKQTGERLLQTVEDRTESLIFHTGSC
jgi:hypothetical protein